MVGISTAAPTVVTPFGALPCGAFSSIDTGNGPSQFRLSSAFDGDLVTQEWYGWLAGSGGGGGGPAATFTAAAPPAGANYTITLPVGVTGLVLLWEAALFAGAGVVVVVTTTGTGTPAGIPAASVTNGVTTAYPVLWTWLADGSGETITVTGTAVTAYLYSWAIIPSPATLDIDALSVQSGQIWTIAFGPLAGASEWVMTGAVIASNANAFEVGFFAS
jgi:hypothetical protein